MALCDYVVKEGYYPKYERVSYSFEMKCVSHLIYSIWVVYTEPWYWKYLYWDDYAFMTEAS